MAAARFLSIPLLLLQLATVSLSEQFRDSPISRLALTNHPLTLSCYAPDPSPPPSIIWLHNEIYQPSDSRRNVTYDPTTGRSTYQLLEVSYSDSGQYQCLAVDETANILFQSDVGILSVQGQPAFSQPLMPVITPLGRQATFQCRVVSNPPANVSWAFGTLQDTLSNGGRIFFNSSVLIISNAQPSDEGQYYCIAENSYGINSTSASFTIGDPPPLLQLIISPSDNPLQALEGSDVTVRCVVNEGSAVNTLHWLHRGVEITDQVTRESDGLTLNLDNLTVEDGGEYSCIASSSDGSTVTATTQLEVLIPPTVELIPNDILVVNYTLSPIPQCNARGIPIPTVTWIGPDGEPLVVENGVTIFGPLTRSATGVYACVATNSAGQGRSELTLTVEDTPLITVPPTDTLVAYGNDVTLVCVAEGPPPPNIVWTREGGGSLGNSTVEVTGTLHLFSVSEEDGGVYICEASNGYDPAARLSVTLTVLRPPVVTSVTVLPAPILLQGADFSIRCTVSAPPAASVSINWYRDGTLLVPTGDPRIQIDTESGTLAVYNADESYSAVYTCNASTSYAFDTSQVTVIIGSAPVVTVPPSDVDLQPGEGAFLDCAVSGSPDPHTEWFVTNEMESRSQLNTIIGEHYIIHTDGIELRNVTQEDSGVYECVVGNVLGSDTKTARVRVEGLPVPLSFSPIVLIANDNYTLTCDIIYNFPMATISWRRTDATLLPSDRFHTTPTGVLEITPVEPGDEGIYECVATNEYGEAVVSQQVTVHVRPTVTVTSSPLTAILFDDVTLACSVQGSPTPSQQWRLNNGASPSGSRYEVAGGDLTITPVRVADMGNYTCMASNLVGVASGVVEVLVRGAPISNLTAVVINSTAASLSWSHPPSLFYFSLQTYHVQYGISGLSPRETLEYGREVNFVLFEELEEATQYQFSVYGVYGDGVQGVEVTVTATTEEDVPTAAPQNVSLDGEVEALDITWMPPLERERNGLIVRYDIYYREMDSKGAESDSESPFIKVEHIPSNPLATAHSTRLGGLEGGVRYEVKISAATAAGVGPNSTLVSEDTLEPFPLLLVLAISVPAATILLLFCLLTMLCVCYRCCHHKSGKHSPLVEEAAFSEQKRRKQKRHKRDDKVISGPVPGIHPNIDTTTGKFTMQTKQGQMLSTDPKVIMPEDVAPPPEEGGVVKQVSHNEVLTSLKRKREEDPYEEITMDGPFVSPYQPNDVPPNVRSNPLYTPDSQDDLEQWGDPHYERLNHSDEQVLQMRDPSHPAAHRQQFDVSILLQGGSLPHMAHKKTSTEPAPGLGDKSQSLDMNADVWTGLPLIREAEKEGSGSEDERLEEQRQGEGEGDGTREREGSEEMENEERKEVSVEEREEWVQEEGDGWEKRLEEVDRGQKWSEEGIPREAEEEEEDEGGSREWRAREGRRNNVTVEGWQERYVGEEGEEPEITPAPLEEAEDDLIASNNALDLATQGAEPGDPETEQDTENLIYATIPESYKAKKRVKMMKDAQKQDRKARKEKRKVEGRAERERRKAVTKQRKQQEKERKRLSNEMKLRDEMGLGNTMTLHDVNSSPTHQAQFISAATAALF